MLSGSTKEGTERYEDMDGEFHVTAPSLVRLCDVVLDGQPGAEALHSIGFALMASDTFCWDADEDEVLSRDYC